VGLRGIRIQNIVGELNGEKIDVVAWSPEPGALIANALNPAQILGVELNRAEGVATVTVPDRQLSLAIGKEGQNVRLAAKLTGWRIDIKSASVVEAERVAAEAEQAAARPAVADVAVAVEAVGAAVGGLPGSSGRVPEPVSVGLAVEAVSLPQAAAPAPVEKVSVRFAEDLLSTAKSEPKKKKKKGSTGKESDEDIAARRLRRAGAGADYSADEDEEF
jgi:N utilization substance protein A